MQIENLHEMSNPIFWEKEEKYHQFVVCKISPEVVKVNNVYT